MLSTPALDEVLRPDGVKWAGAMYTASDGRAEPNRASAAIARGAALAGARIFTSCAVRGIERSAGRVVAAVTEHGVMATRAVVCAGGAWTRLFCGSLGITVPQLTVLGSVARTAPTDQVLAGEAWSPRVAIRRRADGGYTVAHGGSFLHSITPATLRFAGKFLPALRQGHGSTRLAIGRRVLPGARHAGAMAAGRALAVRARARARSVAGTAGSRAGSCSPAALVSRNRVGAVRRGLGWHDRDLA